MRLFSDHFVEILNSVVQIAFRCYSLQRLDIIARIYITVVLGLVGEESKRLLISGVLKVVRDVLRGKCSLLFLGDRRALKPLDSTSPTETIDWAANVYI